MQQSKERPRACDCKIGQEDALDKFGRTVVAKLRTMEPIQRKIALAICKEVVFQGQKKLLPTLGLRKTYAVPDSPQQSGAGDCSYETSQPIRLHENVKEAEVAASLKSVVPNVKEETGIEHDGSPATTRHGQDGSVFPEQPQECWIKTELDGQDEEHNDQEVKWDVSDVKVEPEVEMTIDEHCAVLNTSLGAEVEGNHADLSLVDDTTDLGTDNSGINTSSLNGAIHKILNVSVMSTVKPKSQPRKRGRPLSGKIHTCTVCSKTFATSSHLTSHLRVHSGERPYICHTCGKCFGKGSDLRRHMRVHSGERPHRCQTCGKGFVRRCDLNGHLRVHTGERPYECQTCGKRFVNSSDLTCHLRIHTGERPYVCHKCGKSFVKSTDLSRHVRTHAAKKS